MNNSADYRVLSMYGRALLLISFIVDHLNFKIEKQNNYKYIKILSDLISFLNNIKF